MLIPSIISSVYKESLYAFTRLNHLYLCHLYWYQGFEMGINDNGIWPVLLEEWEVSQRWSRGGVQGHSSQHGQKGRAAKQKWQS